MCGAYALHVLERDDTLALAVTLVVRSLLLIHER